MKAGIVVFLNRPGRREAAGRDHLPNLTRFSSGLAFRAANNTGRAIDQWRRPMAKQTCAGEIETGGMKCTLSGAEVDEHGVLHCRYDCVPKPTKAPDKAQLEKLGALAEAAAKHLNVKDPESVHKVNADLKKVRAELRAFAKARKLTITRRKVSPITSRASS